MSRFQIFQIVYDLFVAVFVALGFFYPRLEARSKQREKARRIKDLVDECSALPIGDKRAFLSLKERAVADARMIFSDTSLLLFLGELESIQSSFILSYAHVPPPVSKEDWDSLKRPLCDLLGKMLRHVKSSK